VGGRILLIEIDVIYTLNCFYHNKPQMETWGGGNKKLKNTLLHGFKNLHNIGSM
jgi:hypothetical protein